MLLTLPCTNKIPIKYCGGSFVPRNNKPDPPPRPFNSFQFFAVT